MTFSEGIKSFGKTIVKASKSIANAFMNADIKVVAKLGTFVGVAAVTVVLAIKCLKDKKKLYNKESNKSTVDRALQLNYSDLRNQEELHPMMREVKKELNKHLKPRYKKKAKAKLKRYNVGSFSEYLERSREEDDMRYYSSHRGELKNQALIEMEQFIKDVDMMEAREKAYMKNRPRDTFKLREVWDTAY